MYRLSTLAICLLLPGSHVHARSPYPATSKSDSHGPQSIMVLDGSPVHNVGELKLHMSNWGMFGSWPGAGFPYSFAPSGEWPAASGIEHVFVGGLWVGALKGGVPAVSTAAFQFEFRPTAAPVDVLYRSAEGAVGGVRFPAPGADDDNDGTTDEEFLDGRDNDLDGQIDEDYAAVSDQMFSRWYTDDQPEAIQAYPQHNPLHITVRERSYQWEHDDYDDFVGIDYEITNTGTEALEQVYVGVFLDGDVGNRNTPNYFENDVAGFGNFPVVCTVDGAVRLQYGYIGDTGGSALAVLLLDHPTDPNGEQAPAAVRWATFARFHGSAAYEDGGDPTNDFERFELMSSRTIERDGTSPADYRILLCVGPFESIDPGEIIEFSVALVAIPTPNDQLNLARAAIAYRGRWFNRDGDPNTGIEGRETPVMGPAQVAVDPCRPPHDVPIDVPRGTTVWINGDCEEEGFFRDACGYDPSEPELFATGVNGKEHHVHWILPHEIVTPVAIQRFDARRDGRAVNLVWEIWSDEEIVGYEILRATGRGSLVRLTDAIRSDQHSYRDENVTAGSRYEYQLIARAASGSTSVSQRVAVTMPPLALALETGAPNPFKDATRIRFTVPERSRVNLSVFDAAGRRVATIVSGDRPAGAHEVSWDGTDNSGRRVSAGVYFCRLEAGKETMTRKLSLMK